MKLLASFESKVLAALGAAMLVVVTLTAMTWAVANDAAEASRWIGHTQEVLASLARIRNDSVQIEFITQSYRISGDQNGLAERDAAIASREAQLRWLKERTSDNPRQQALWAQLREVLDERLAIASRMVELRQTQGQEAATAFAARAPLQETRTRTYRILQDMEVLERGLLETRRAMQSNVRQRMVLTGALVSVVLIFMLFAAYGLIRRQLRETRASQRALAESEESLATTLNSIGDAVMATDTAGRITGMNPVAVRLTGWSVPHALGRPIEEVFHVVHEQTRAPVEAPVTKVLATGEVQELANHTILIARDGSECPIADSAAPIRDVAGRVVGVVFVFRDETVARQAKQAIRERNQWLEQCVLERTEALQAREQQLSRVLEGSDQGYWDWNLKSNDFQVSARLETMLGYAPGEMRVDTAHWPELVHPEDLPLALASIERHMSGARTSHEVEFRAKAKDGSWRWILTRGRITARAEDGTPLMMSGTHTDVTERKQFELAQREAGVVFDRSYEGIMVANADGLITKVNPAFTRITGYEASEVTGCSPRMLSSGRQDARFYQEFWESLNRRDFWRGEIWNKRKTGELYAVLQSISVVRDVHAKVLHYVSVFTDITQIKAHEAELDRVANYDALTGLPNRRLLSDRLKQAILRSDRSGKLCAICFLDLDGFKFINDRMGHLLGDQLLIGVAGHLQTVLRAGDTLSRLSGDEFVLLLSDVNSLAECTLILDRVLEAVRRPVTATGHVLAVTASIGVSLYPDDKVDPDTLLRHADQAMYLAKQAGKNRYQLFDAEIGRRVQNHLEVLEHMKQALGRQEFLLFYQPQVDIGSGEVLGVEALIRWQHPERGLLPPSDFLPHLQGSLLEQVFGEWVIETALQQIEAWARLGLELKVSVNVSADHLLQSDFSNRLAQALARHADIKPAWLELEVLETAAIGDMQQAVDIMQSCRLLGVSFSLDDFGTGYASLTYLRKLPVDTLKIDQSFVRDMLTNPDDLSIVQSVVELAAAFHRRVIAEGVETLEHCDALLQMGCHHVQGYGIAKPMSAQQIPAWCDMWLQSGGWQQHGPV
ncbi:MAG: EAL domain-containing protein [Rhodoferax sp.]|uniref:EAL domain-containing protein n=1 Tax=Rhodoferax sp. TaxID=50421 RepID=UPI003BB6E8A2